MRNGSDERISVTGALASLLAVMTLSPLVTGRTWLFVAAITVVTIMVSGIVARQLLRWWPLVAAAQVGVLLVTLVVLFARSRILEGPGAIDLLRQLVEAGLQVTREQAPPVESTQGIMLLMAASAGVIALLVDLLAATLRQPALAGLPLLAVYCVPAALLDGGLPWYYFLIAASGFLVLLTADSGDRVRGWGRVLASSAAGGRRRPADGGMAAGGRRVGATVVVLAVIVPTLVPGLSNQIIGGNGDGDGDGKGGRTITRINPILDLRKDLANREDTELLTYTTTVKDPAPLRIVTSDVFDGKTWSPSTDPIPRSQKARGSMPQPPGLSDEVSRTQAETEIRIGPLNETYLPLPYPATSVSVSEDWLYDANTLNVIGDGVTTQKLNYTVAHLEIEPTARQLAASPAPSAGLSGDYLDLPTDLPAVIGTEARRIAKTGTQYEQAVRLQRWFRSDAFEYTLDAPEAPGGASGSEVIVKFLEQKKGYCVHYASTMAVMARLLNIPARVAVGFLPGERQSDGSMRISANDAHAWPELYFEGVGWVRFEPTPRSGSVTPPEWSTPPAGVLPEDEETAEPEASESAEPNPGTSSQAPRPVDEAAPAAAATPQESGLPWTTLLIVLAVILVLISPRVTFALSSRRRWSRVRSGPGRAEAAWDELRLGLQDLGVEWANSWTPRAVEHRLKDDYSFFGASATALGQLTDEVENARYAPPGPDPGRAVGERRADVSVVLAAVAATLPGRTRWLTRLWPQSGVTTLAGLGPLAGAAVGRRVNQLTSRFGRAQDVDDDPPTLETDDPQREKVGSF